MSYRKPYVATLQAMGPYFGALLGLIARIRQEVSGTLPTRLTWTEDLENFIESDSKLRRDEITGDAGTILEEHFPLGMDRPKQLKLSEEHPERHESARILADFIGYWLTGKAPEFKNDKAREILSKLELGEGITEILFEVQDNHKPPRNLLREIVGDLIDIESAWSPGLRPFGWPSVRSGFVTYQPISQSGVRGLYLLVREARGWTTSDADSSPALVRDLLWIRAEPNDEFKRPDPDFEGLGRYFSTFNETVYRLRTAAGEAAPWHRFQGPSLKDGMQVEIEIASPSLGRVDGSQPAFALMSAHTRSGNRAGVWKALILRVGDGAASEWLDMAAIEPELEMFCGEGKALADTNTKALIKHLKDRGIIGVFPEDAEASSLFLELIGRHHPADYQARLREKLALATQGAADPVEAIVANWHLIDPAQIVLPLAEEARIPEERSDEARAALFGRTVFGPDQVAKRLANLAAPKRKRPIAKP